MSRASEVLEQLRHAEAAAREEIGRLLAPAGLVVGEARVEGDGWRLLVVPLRSELRDGQGSAAVEPLARAAAPGPAPLARGAEPLVRRPGETLIGLVSRAGDQLRVSRGEGQGGIRVAAATNAERVEWLAGTLVGDTILALRHLGEAEDGERAFPELQRQVGLFQDESRRLGQSDDPAPFMAAVARWTPAGLPRGGALVAPRKEVGDA
jgi:hypothetical protein